MSTAGIPWTHGAVSAVFRSLLESRAAKIAGLGLIAFLTLVPVLNILWIVASTGVNTVSNDYLFYVRIIDPILSGTYNWRHFFYDTFIAGAHCMALPMLVRLGVVKFASWNIYFELSISFTLAVLKLILLHQTFTHLTPRASCGVSRGLSRCLSWWMMWPVLAALVFSTSQINVFTFGDAGLQIMLVQFGCALGIWGVVRFRGRWRGIAIMAAGGAIATLSGGGGLLAWPICLIGLVLLGYRKVSHYAAWLGAAAVASLPYVCYIVLWPTQPRKTPSLFNYEFIINAIGWPFANGIGSTYNSIHEAVLAGYWGIALAITGLVLLWRKRRTPVLTQATPGLMYMVLGLLGIWQTSLFRTTIAPWYTSAFLLFWIGLAGLAYVFWVNRQFRPAEERPFQRAITILIPLWSISLAGILVYLYATSNIAYADKAFYLRSRGPAAASCLRNYRVAPTYCEQYVFQWGVGNFGLLADLARPLERHGLSVFAPRQQWTLQGDYVLDNVRPGETPGVPNIFWSADLTAAPTLVSDYKHLNLFLHSPNTLSWRVSLPGNVKQADFHSAVAISKYAPVTPSSDGVTFEVSVEVEGQSDLAEQPVFQQHLAARQHSWQPFTIPLTAYAGRTIVLRLTSKGGANIEGDWAMFRYPYIDVTLNPAPPSAEDMPGKPFRVQPSADDTRFDATDVSLWQASKMQLEQTEAGVASTWKVSREGSLEYKPALNLCLADYTHFYVRLAVSPDVQPRALLISYKLDGQPAFSPAQAVKIPLFGDGEMHEYTFDLKLLFINKGTSLTGLRLDPISDGIALAESRAEIADFRLLRRDSPKWCMAARN